MPRPARRLSPPAATREPARPLAKAPGRAVRTPEEIARATVAKLSSPVGAPDKAELAVRLVLPRAALERLIARAIRDGVNVPGLIETLIVAAAEDA